MRLCSEFVEDEDEEDYKNIRLRVSSLLWATESETFKKTCELNFTDIRNLDHLLPLQIYSSRVCFNSESYEKVRQSPSFVHRFIKTFVKLIKRNNPNVLSCLILYYALRTNAKLSHH